MAKMTQSQMLDVLAKETGFKKSEIKNILEAMTDLALKEVKKNGEFTIKGIGKLVKQKRKARMGRNPATGETIKIPAKTVVKFRVAKAAKDSVL
ncbi:MAG: HU family DNA-binding protein [Candidatus Buchananbacteria bacterium]|nr:HU family DNA-binding protein [Candidatus Buchananbacteria bacterium]